MEGVQTMTLSQLKLVVVSLNIQFCKFRILYLYSLFENIVIDWFIDWSTEKVILQHEYEFSDNAPTIVIQIWLGT